MRLTMFGTRRTLEHQHWKGIHLLPSQSTNVKQLRIRLLEDRDDLHLAELRRAHLNLLG